MQCVLMTKFWNGRSPCARRGGLVTPEDIAGVVAFLCSPQGSMIRGQTIQVDGGYTLPVAGVIPPKTP